MDEEWVMLLEFPMYEISNYGDVKNRNSGRIVAKSVNKQGVVKIGLFRDGKQYTRSVATLVGQLFVQGRNDLFDTIIHLDGDLSNCHYTNLMWRPRWFAYQYHRQFHNPEQRAVCLDSMGLHGPVFELRDNTHYSNIFEAATTNGILIRELFARIYDHYNNGVFPTGQVFSFDPERSQAEISKSKY